MTIEKGKAYSEIDINNENYFVLFLDILDNEDTPAIVYYAELGVIEMTRDKEIYLKWDITDFNFKDMTLL